MDIDYVLSELSFSYGPTPFASPTSRVRILPAGTRAPGRAVIDLSISLAGEIPPGTGAQEAAEAALRIARELVPESAARRHLRTLMDDEWLGEGEGEAEAEPTSQDDGAAAGEAAPRTRARILEKMSSPLWERRIGIPWYESDDFAHIRQIMEDAHLMPSDYHEWRLRAEERERQLQWEGRQPVRATLRAGEFAAWCRTRRMRLNSHGRNEYASWFAARHDALTHQPPDAPF
jgi:hypothetical protein